MSIKTLRKRIALVAVSALGASALSLLAVAPASAEVVVGDLDITAKTGLVNTGACAVSNSDTAGATVAYFRTGTSVQLEFDGSVDADDAYLKIASGPAVWTEGPSGGATVTDTVISDTVDDTETVKLSLTGTGTVKIQVRDGLTSAGTLVDVITIYSVAACGGGKFSAANSNIIVTTADGTNNEDEDYADDQAAFNGVDRSNSLTQDATESGYISMVLLDEYDLGLDAGTALVASTNAGCLVGLAEITDEDANPGVDNSVDTFVTEEDGDSEFAAVVALSSTQVGTPTKCTVAISFDGAEIAKKTISFRGAPTQVLVDKVTVGQKDGVGAYRVAVKDAAGNLLGDVAISNSTTEANNLASATVVSDSSSVAISTEEDESDATFGYTLYTTAALVGGTTASFECTDKGGPAKLTVRALVSPLTYVTSAPFDVYCGGTAVDTYTASLDKAVYAPGEIATLTITAKDAKGHFVGTLVSINDGEDITASFGGMEFVTDPAAADVFSSGLGSKTYQLKVGTDEGAFVGTVTMANAGTDSTAKTIQYSVKAPATGAVSNAEVLAAIVKLIASINKQIAKLQKLIRKK